MPSPAIFIKAESLSRYPGLAACLFSESVNIEQLNRLLENNECYDVELSDDDDYHLSLLQILSLYGNRESIERLTLSLEEKKEATKAGGYYAIQLAARNGHTTTIQYLEKYLTDEEKTKRLRQMITLRFNSLLKAAMPLPPNI